MRTTPKRQFRSSFRAVSNFEIVHFIKKEMADPSRKVLYMNIINEIYRRILSSKAAFTLMYILTVYI